MDKTNKYDSQHWRNQATYERQVDAIYRAVAKEAAALGVSIKDFNPDRLFSFSDNPTTRKKIEKLLSDLQADIETIIVNGIRSEWTLANNKNNELARQVFGDNVGKLTKEQERRYFSTNSAARDAFITRKTDGLGLSDRVWKYTEQFKEEIELGLDIGIRNGRSADELSRDLRNYLQHPDKLFRRVRNEHGQLVLSQRAKAYHPGRGVYRSSYKNARRLAATETNIAYRTADYERWQQFDFVVGIRVVMSGNHPIKDICDELSANSGSTANSGRGCYPKDFKFTGWHPLCRCHVETILKTPDELMADNRRIIDGEKPNETSANTVKGMPQEFKDWVRKNSGRIERAKSLPYFIKDNKKVIDNILSPKPTPIEIAKARHTSRTDKQTKEIKKLAWDRQLRMNMPNLTEQEREAIVENWLNIEQALGIKKGRMMTIEEADKQSANPKYGTDRAYGINCQTCAPAYMLRQWGFDVTAKPKTPGSLSEYLARQHSFEAWVNVDGTESKPILQYDWLDSKGYKLMTEKRWRQYFNECCQEIGTYLLTIGWKGGGGHATILQKTPEGLFYIEPQAYNAQIGAKRPIDELCESGATKPIRSRGILRIDNKLFVLKFLSIFDK